MINQTKKITDFIQVFENVLSDSLCDHVIKVSQNYPWQKHLWYGYDAKYNSHVSHEGDDKEFYRAAMDKITQLQVYPIIDDCIKNYRKICNIPIKIDFKSPVQVSKYDIGTRMLAHEDHIYSCFDGTKKGIPVLSVVALCNDNFTGGEFVFWDDYKINLKKGDLVVFPSLFMYTHRVNEITQGTRYSLVCWYW